MPYLSTLTVTFYTGPKGSASDNKDFDTDLYIGLKDNSGVRVLGNFGGVPITGSFSDKPPSTHTFTYQGMNTPVFDISNLNRSVLELLIVPNGNDTWLFEISIKLTYSDGSEVNKIINGNLAVILWQNNPSVEIPIYN